MVSMGSSRDATGTPPPRTSCPDPSILHTMADLGRLFPAARVREVPLLRAADLDARADPSGRTRIWLALEALQVTGSFQVRGALVALALAMKHRPAAEEVVSSSVGNQGVAVAYAAAILGISATVVVPCTAPRSKREKIERYGAELVVATAGAYEDAETLALHIASSRQAVFLPSTDDMPRALGNGASLGFEIARALGAAPDSVIVPFCNDGLATGLSWTLAAEKEGSRPTVVWGVDSQVLRTGAPSRTLDPSFAQVVTLADELAVGMNCTRSRSDANIKECAPVGEREIAEAIAYAYRDIGLVIEGTAAVPLAPVLSGLPDPMRGGEVVVVLTGRNIDAERLEAVLAGARG
jgi:threonine dehydratase